MDSNHYKADTLGVAGVRWTQPRPDRGAKGEKYDVGFLQDTGCPIAKACLRCHLPRCILDELPKNRPAIFAALGVNPRLDRTLFY